MSARFLSIRSTGGKLKQVGVALAVVGWLLAAIAPAATASVTIGQTAPGTTLCPPGFDRVQPTVTSGNPYVVPEMPPARVLTLTSWSTDATGDSGSVSALVLRRVAAPGNVYQAVGHDGPRILTPGVLNTFQATIPVKPGDVLGISIPPDSTYERCVFSATGDGNRFRSGNLADGEQGDFAVTSAHSRLNISAVVQPSNSFTLGTIARNKKKGTATLTLNLPNPGELTGSGGGAKVAGGATSSKAVPAGQATLVIRAKGKRKAKLIETGKVKVKPTITYTPTGGDPGTQKLKLKLLKR